MGMALAAVSENGDGLAFEHRKVGILIIIGFHEILRMINHGTQRNAAVPNCKRLPVWKPAPSPQPALAGIGKQQDRKRAAVRYSSPVTGRKNMSICSLPETPTPQGHSLTDMVPCQEKCSVPQRRSAPELNRQILPAHFGTGASRHGVIMLRRSRAVKRSTSPALSPHSATHGAWLQSRCGLFP